jgi:hypothetical protein
MWRADRSSSRESTPSRGGSLYLPKGVRFQLLLIRDSAVFEAPMPSVDAIAVTPTRQHGKRLGAALVEQGFGVSSACQAR